MYDRSKGTSWIDEIGRSIVGLSDGYMSKEEQAAVEARHEQQAEQRKERDRSVSPIAQFGEGFGNSMRTSLQMTLQRTERETYYGGSKARAIPDVSQIESQMDNDGPEFDQ